MDPSIYETWRGSELGRLTETREREVLRQLLGPVKGLSVLDVGCGDGDLALDLHDAGARVTCIDNSSAMVKAARRRCKHAGAHIMIEQANARALPFPPASFDRVVTVTMLCFVDNALLAIREMARVLRPGGRLIVGDLNRWSLWAAQRRLRGWLGDELWRGVRFHSAGQIADLLRDAGLTLEGNVVGAVYYPPLDWAARRMIDKDTEFSQTTTLGAAFLAAAARK